MVPSISFSIFWFCDLRRKYNLLLGAGASAEALPFVKNIKVDGEIRQGIPASFRELADKLILETDV